jgi:hypothetical protein
VLGLGLGLGLELGLGLGLRLRIRLGLGYALGIVRVIDLHNRAPTSQQQKATFCEPTKGRESVKLRRPKGGVRKAKKVLEEVAEWKTL